MLELKPGYHLRKLNSGDLEKGYLRLLGELTTVTELSQQRFDDILKTYDSHYCAVIEDSNGVLVGFCLLIELGL